MCPIVLVMLHSHLLEEMIQNQGKIYSQKWAEYFQMRANMFPQFTKILSILWYEEVFNQNIFLEIVWLNSRLLSSVLEYLGETSQCHT